MRAQFSRHLGDLAERLTSAHTVSTSLERVDGADIVQSTASDELARGGVGTGHDPGRTEGNGMNLVGGVSVPHDQFAVLRRRDDVPVIGRPMHGVDLGEVTLEGTSDAHDHAGQGFDFLSHRSDCRSQGQDRVSPRAGSSRLYLWAVD